MIILKYLKKVVAKYKERMEPGSCGGTGTGGLVATATIINQKRRVSKIVEESYSTCLTRLHQHPDVVTQAHKFVTTQRGTGRRSRSSRLTPIAESSSSAASSHLSEHSSLCYSCERDYIGNKKFCKCCGKGLMSQRLRVIKSSRYDETRSFYAREFKHRSSQRPSSHRRVSSTHRRSVSKQQAKLTCNLFGEASSRTGGGVYKTTYLKKSKACSNIKQQRVESKNYLNMTTRNL